MKHILKDFMIGKMTPKKSENCHISTFGFQ